MAVNIDNVYQKVLALANKEQRGYITPQEFNLLADKAQKDIFESWVLTAKFYGYPNEWLELFSEASYKGDWYWTIIE